MDNKYQCGFVDEVCLAGKYRGKTLEEGQLQFFPNNCIGLVRLKGAEGSQGFGTGCLISSCTVLTAAHLFFSINEGQLLVLKPYQFCLNLYQDVSSSNKITVINYQFPKRFQELYRQLAKYKPNSLEHYNLIKESQQYDYALLKLQKNVKMPAFPTLYPNFEGSNQRVIVCGYSEETSLNYYQIWHANPVYMTETGGVYDIDTKRGQSGSPVYFMKSDQRNNKQACYMIGIHKGHDRKFKKNVCTLITSEVMINLQNWLMKMNISFDIKYNKSSINSDLKSQKSTINYENQNSEIEALKHANAKLVIKNEDLIKKNIELQQKNKQLTTKYQSLYQQLLAKKRKLEDFVQEVVAENKNLKENQEAMKNEKGQYKLLEMRSNELAIAKAEINALKKALEAYEDKHIKTMGSPSNLKSHSLGQIGKEQSELLQNKGKKFKSETEQEQKIQKKSPKNKLAQSPPMSSGVSAQDYYNLGNKYKQAHKHYEAIMYYKKCIELDPANMLAYNNLSVVLFMANEWQQAVSCLRAIIKINPTYTLAYDNLYRLFKKRPTATKELKETIQLMDNVLLVNPKNKAAKEKQKQLKDLLP